MKFICIGGEPGTGKSGIVKSILEKLGTGYDFKFNLLRGYKYPTLDPRIIVLGIYEDGVLFSGTDRLSMIAIKSIKELVHFCVENNVFMDYTILFEGDRFFKQNFFETLDSLNVDYSLFILKVDDDVLNSRREARSDNNQSDKFLKGRRTMYSNIEEHYPHKLTLLPSNTLEDQKNNVELIWNTLFSK